MRAITSLLLLLAALAALAQATSYTPSSRNVKPKAIFRTTGKVVTAPGSGEASQTVLTLSGSGASVTFDFGQITAGIPTIRFGPSTNCGFLRDCSFGLPSFVCFGLCQGLGVGYTESERFVKADSDQSFLQGFPDTTLFLPIPKGAANYTLPAKWGRGGFRFLTLSLDGRTPADTKVELSVPYAYYTAEPGTADLAPTGSFESSDSLLNDIWAAGAYTTQLCTIGANTSVSRADPIGNRLGWAQDDTAAPLGPSDSYLADGARRDRNAWAGDLQVSTPTALVSLNRGGSLLSVRKALDVLYHAQNGDGLFAYAGAPLLTLLNVLPTGIASFFGITSAYNSDTYHLWTIIAFADYVLATGDFAYASSRWAATVRAVDVLRPNIDAATGLLRVTRPQDWGRVGQSGLSTSGNALYFHALKRLSLLARTVPGLPNAASLSSTWDAIAARVKESVNFLLYVPSAGLFKDNTTAAGAQLFPQDGNVVAVTFGLVRDDAQARTVVDSLRRRWTPFGAPAPELPGYVSPFISSQEVWAQFLARPGDAGPGLELIRRQWGYMRRAFSNETLIEGYAADGRLEYGFYGPNPSFISLTHAWSTGPTYALTTYVAGLRATRYGVQDAATEGEWKFMPAVHGSGLTYARAAFTANGRSYASSWKSQSTSSFAATLSVPRSSRGTVCVPTLGRSPSTVKPLVNSRPPANVSEQPGYLCWSNQAGGSLKISA